MSKPKTTVQANINDEKKVTKVKEFLDYRFTEEELRDMSEDMARSYQEQTALENEKKATTAEFTAKIEGKKALIESLALKISNKQEHRYVECELRMNVPIETKKQLVRLDTGIVVWEKNMTAEELQLKLNLDASSAMATHSDYEDNHK